MGDPEFGKVTCAEMLLYAVVAVICALLVVYISGIWL